MPPSFNEIFQHCLLPTIESVKGHVGKLIICCIIFRISTQLCKFFHPTLKFDNLIHFFWNTRFSYSPELRILLFKVLCLLIHKIQWFSIILYNTMGGNSFGRSIFLLFTRFHNFSWLISEIIGKSKMLILGQKFNHKNPPKTEIHEYYLTQILQLFLEYYLVYYLVWRYYNSYFYFSIRHTKMVGPYFILNHRPGPSY